MLLPVSLERCGALLLLLLLLQTALEAVNSWPYQSIKLQISSFFGNKLLLPTYCCCNYCLLAAAAAAAAGGLGRCQLQRCSISGNKLNGVLARDGAELDMAGCSIQGNGGYGVQLQVRSKPVLCSSHVFCDGAELDMAGCSIQGNGSYGVQLQLWCNALR
jgi:hypothetical protein